MEITKNTTMVTITVDGVTREVEASTYAPLDETHSIHVYGVVAVIGRGRARYPSTVNLHRLRDEDPRRPGTTTVTDSEGRKWTYHLGTVVRNRQASVVAWQDVAPATNVSDNSRT